MCSLSWTRAALPGLAALTIACGGAPRAAAGIPASPSAVPRNGLEVIGAMRQAHPSRALRSISLAVSIVDTADSSRVTRSRVQAQLPGRIRVESLPASSRTGYVRHRQRVAVFEQGRRVASVDRVDIATLVAYDVFAQSIDTTIMWLDSSRMRFGLARLDELDGRKVWVVGALEGDTTSTQFWVDAREWRVVRVIQREPWNGNQLVDTRFTEFMTIRNVPVPKRMLVYRGGRLAQRQEISVLQVNPRMSSATFDLARWRPGD